MILITDNKIRSVLKKVIKLELQTVRVISMQQA